MLVKILRIAFLCLTLSANLSMAFADTRVVSAFGETPYTDIQAAVDASADGDIIVVRPGDYTGFQIDGKGVKLWVQSPSITNIDPYISIRNLTPLQEVILVGMTITPEAQDQPQNVLTIRDCSGRVSLQDCVIVGEGAESGPSGICQAGTAIYVEDSQRVRIVDCTVTGGKGKIADCNTCPTGRRGGEALTAVNASIESWGSTFLGGGGGSNTCGLGGNGGDSILLQFSRALLVGCHVEGGTGGASTPFLESHGGAGLRGFMTVSPGVLVQGTSFAGGRGGQWGPDEYGPDGPARIGVSPTNLSGDNQVARCSSSGTVGDSLPVQITGTPASSARVWITSTWPCFFDALAGVANPPTNEFSQLPVPHYDQFLGTVDPNGNLDTTLVLPSLEPGNLAAGRYVVSNSTGEQRSWLLASPRWIFAVDCGAVDCDSNGSGDNCEIVLGSAPDVDGDLALDYCPGMSTWYVDPAAAPGGDGSASAPFQTILQGYDAAVDGHEILLADGVYQGPGNQGLDLVRKRLVLRSLNGPSQCILDAGSTSRFFSIASSTLIYDEGPTIEGLTFRNGNGQSSFQPDKGGALHFYKTDFIIRNCIFESNVGSLGGGAIYAGGEAGEPWDGGLVEDCTFVENRAVHPNFSVNGGAVNGANVLLNCTFESNSCDRDGGAVAYATVIHQCRFLGNQAVNGGAILANELTLTQSLFAGNQATTRGGAINFRGAGDPIALGMLVNSCTFVDNKANVKGGAIYYTHVLAYGLRVQNSILAQNEASSGDAISTTSRLEIFHSTVGGGMPSVELVGLSGLLSTIDYVYGIEPTFVDADGPDNDPLTWADNDYRLAPGSPQIDAGNNALIPFDTFDLDGDGVTLEPVPFDLLGQTRRVDVPTAIDWGTGGAPLVDQGAYETQ